MIPAHLLPGLVARRARGSSADALQTWLRNSHGVRVSRDTIRQAIGMEPPPAALPKIRVEHLFGCGHPRTPENTAKRKGCRICHNRWQVEYQRARRGDAFPCGHPRDEDHTGTRLNGREYCRLCVAPSCSLGITLPRDPDRAMVAALLRYGAKHGCVGNLSAAECRARLIEMEAGWQREEAA